VEAEKAFSLEHYILTTSPTLKKDVLRAGAQRFATLYSGERSPESVRAQIDQIRFQIAPLADADSATAQALTVMISVLADSCENILKSRCEKGD